MIKYYNTHIRGHLAETQGYSLLNLSNSEILMNNVSQDPVNSSPQQNFYHRILDIETKHHLFNKTVPIRYSAYRYELVKLLIERVSIQTTFHGKKSPISLYSLTKETFKLLSKIPQLMITNAKIIVIKHEREIGEKLLFTKQVISDLKKTKEDYLVLGHMPTNSSTVPLAPIIALAHATKALFFLKTYELKELKKILDTFDELITDKNQKSFIHGEIQKLVVLQKSKSFWLTLLWKMLKPQHLIHSSSYSNTAVIDSIRRVTPAAKVYEVQHGLIYNTHPGYNYPSKVVHNHAPDLLLTFGSDWKKVMNMPQNTHVVTFKYHTPTSKTVEKKDDRLILFASQNPIASYLFNFCVEVAQLLPEYSIIYKLHPTEDMESSLFKNAKNYPNLTLDKSDIYELMNKSSVQVGVYSTTLIEGIDRGCLPIIYNCRGAEYMDIIAKKGFPIIQKAEELKQILEKPLDWPPTHLTDGNNNLMQLIKDQDNF